MKSREDLKNESRAFLARNPFIQKMFLLYTIITVVQILFQNYGNNNLFYYSFETANISANFSIVNSGVTFFVGLLQASLMLKIYDVLKRGFDSDNPENNMSFSELITESLYLLKKEYFLPVLIVSILSGLLVFIGFLFFIIPGIILTYAVSQAVLITKDNIDLESNSSFTEPISQSIDLMKGHKMDLFILQFSFIGWYLLVGLTFGVAGYWVYPDLFTRQVLFYMDIKENK